MQAQKALNRDVRVIKVGGGVLRTPDDIVMIGRRIEEIRASGIPPVVIVSALYGITDMLISYVERNASSNVLRYLSDIFSVSSASEETVPLFRALHSLLRDHADNLENVRDEILSYGERFTSCALAEYLNRSGNSSMCIDASDFIRTGEGGNVNVRETRKRVQKLSSYLESGKTVVMPGFYGADSTGRTVLLGRGGSDYSAGIVAGCIGASTLEFWKDVDGIMSADPRYVENPVTFRNVSSGMAMEISMLGGTILHPRALNLVDFSRCRVLIRNVRNPSDFGTIVGIRNRKAASIVVKNNLVLVTWTSESGTGSGIMSLVSRVLGTGREPYSITATGSTVLTIFEQSDFSTCENDLRDVADSVSVRMKVEHPLSMISVISDQPSFSMRKMRAGILSALYEREIFEKAVITLNPNLSFGIVVDRYDSRDAIRIIHDSVREMEV